MAHPLHEVEEEILIRLNVRDLIRCKSVCKSWRSLIMDPRFIKAHLNRDYDNDRKNERIGGRRITMSKETDYLACQKYDTDYNFFDLNDRYLLGSANGLVCVSPSPTKILVINPSTREVKKVTNPQIIETDSLCWGFGYESSTDDYKIVLGFKKGRYHTCFQAFSLRSNVWKVIGEVHYTVYTVTSRVGILCNEALHWLAYDTLSKTQMVILSLHISDEKFSEVPKYVNSTMRLGTMEERLCLFQHLIYIRTVWVMKEYNNKQSWEMFGWEREIKYEVVHNIKLLENCIPNKWPLCDDTCSSKYWLCKNPVFFGTPVYVESLVSPHFHKKPQTKRQATSTMQSPKVKANRYVVALHAIPSAHENANASTSSSACI